MTSSKTAETGGADDERIQTSINEKELVATKTEPSIKPLSESQQLTHFIELCNINCDCSPTQVVCDNESEEDAVGGIPPNEPSVKSQSSTLTSCDDAHSNTSITISPRDLIYDIEVPQSLFDDGSSVHSSQKDTSTPREQQLLGETQEEEKLLCSMNSTLSNKLSITAKSSIPLLDIKERILITEEDIMGGDNESLSSSEANTHIDDADEDEDSKLILSFDEHNEYCEIQHKHSVEKAKKSKCYTEGPTRHPYLQEPQKIEVELEREDFPGVFGLALKGRSIDKIQDSSAADKCNKLKTGMIITKVNNEVVDVQRENHLRLLLSNASLAPACQRSTSTTNVVSINDSHRRQPTTPPVRKRVVLSTSTVRISHSPNNRRRRKESISSPASMSPSQGDLKSSISSPRNRSNQKKNSPATGRRPSLFRSPGKECTTPRRSVSDNKICEDDSPSTNGGSPRVGKSLLNRRHRKPSNPDPDTTAINQRVNRNDENEILRTTQSVDESSSSMGISSSDEEKKTDELSCKSLTMLLQLQVSSTPTNQTLSQDVISPLPSARSWACSNSEPEIKLSSRSIQKVHPAPRRSSSTETCETTTDKIKKLTAFTVGNRQLNPELLSPATLNPQTINKGLAEARRILGTFSYCFTGSKFDIDKTRSVRHMNHTALTILRDGVDIQCVEGTLVGLLLTHDLIPVVRFGLSFETLAADGSLYRHLVLGLKYNKKYCALGISREEDLMTKPSIFSTLSLLINDFIIGYNRIGQIVTKVLISRPISRKDNVVPDWKVGRFPISHPARWTPEFEKRLRNFEMAFLTEAPYSVVPGTARRALIPPLKPIALPQPPAVTTPAAAAATASPRKCLPQTPRYNKFLGLKTPRTKWV